MNIDDIVKEFEEREENSPPTEIKLKADWLRSTLKTFLEEKAREIEASDDKSMLRGMEGYKDGLSEAAALLRKEITN